MNVGPSFFLECVSLRLLYPLFTFYIYICIYIYFSGRILDWRFSQPGFDPSFENLACPATLKSCDTTKQSVCG